MVTSTSSENLFYQRYGFQNQNFDFKTTKTLILQAWSIFSKGAHLTKLWSKKIFSMKTLSKLGALTVVRKSCEIYGTYFFQVRNRGLREGATHLLIARLHVPTHSNNRVVFKIFVVTEQG